MTASLPSFALYCKNHRKRGCGNPSAVVASIVARTNTNNVVKQPCTVARVATDSTMQYNINE